MNTPARDAFRGHVDFAACRNFFGRPALHVQPCVRAPERGTEACLDELKSFPFVPLLHAARSGEALGVCGWYSDHASTRTDRQSGLGSTRRLMDHRIDPPARGETTSGNWREKAPPERGQGVLFSLESANATARQQRIGVTDYFKGDKYPIVASSCGGRRLIATEGFESIRVSQFCGPLLPQPPYVEPDVAVGHLVEEHVFGLGRLLRSS